ncbi:FAD:protein FMN transferase [Desulfurivibrio alkaliphilus]|uniref:FAD:protein FMN transferase n=1 Tax=Desulfurivibrio alkaliphilus (strain DSM 19089 / UNIQEM U267 / AHT2) TaxID=589865 RepID=D6Z598_DESAT|nr:FAD:protein FMN transferase [Desulfurivibrio alkaliphilus]ADH84755.1 ApbE family lipoprotein [Desulfurivibrio alkaliphilus AHT 2]
MAESEKEQGAVFSRRSALKIFALAGAAGAFGLTFAGGERGWQVVRRGQVLMGTPVDLVVYSRDRDQAQAAVAATLARMGELESRLSRFNPDSEVGRLNRSGEIDEAGEDLLAVLALAQQVSAKSDGAFDITTLPLLLRHQQGLTADPDQIAAARRAVAYEQLQVGKRRVRLGRPGMGITLDGIGKGYIVDRGVDTLAAHGFDRVYVAAGGDLVARGGKPRNEPWRIGIAPPRPGMNRELAVVAGDNLAVATSGDYLQHFSADYRHHHIINPRTGFSPPQLASCTVTAPDAALADALATACLVLGLPDSLDLLAAFPGCEGYFIDKDLKVRHTDGFRV